MCRIQPNITFSGGNKPFRNFEKGTEESATNSTIRCNKHRKSGETSPA